MFPHEPESRIAVGGTGTVQDITDRMQAEEQLHRQATIVAGMTDATAIMDTDYKYLFANEAYVTPFGKTVDELIGHTVEEVFGEEVFKTIIKPQAERCLAGERVRYQNWLDLPVGGRTHMDVEYTPYVGPDNEVSGFIVNGRNTTAQKLAEEKLQRSNESLKREIAEHKQTELRLAESEAMFRRLAEKAVVGIYIIQNGTVVYANPSLARIFGYEVEELVGQLTIQDVVHSDDIDAVAKAYFDRLGGLEAVDNVVYRGVRKDGSNIYVEARGQFLEFHGKPAVLGTLVEVSERRQAQERYKTVFEATNAAISISTVDGRIIAANDAYVDLSGYSQEELLELDMNVLYSKAHGRKKILRAIRDHGELRDYEAKIVNKTGETEWVSISTRPTTEWGDNCLLSVVVDITDRKLMEQELETNRHQLQDLSHRMIETQEAERGHIARELHDEIGQGLTTLKLNLQIIDRTTDDPSTHGCVADSLALVEDTLRAVRNLSLDLRPPMLDDLGLKAALRWHMNRQAKPADLTVSFSADGDDTRAPHNVESTCFRVAQEALTNAIRHSRAEHVAIELTSTEAELVLNVRDDGIGFESVTSGTAQSDQMTMGLIGMAERASLVGGGLEINSKPGEGTVVSARFPIQQEMQELKSSGRKV